jgi:transcriptional regulator with XRE-family HTH domain
MVGVLSSEHMAGSSRRGARGAKGDLIRRLRIKRQLRQEMVAERAGISPTHLSRIETGKVEPTRDTIEKIAPVLGVTAAYLDVDALSEAVAETATNPDARSFVERVLKLHDQIALMSPEEREQLFRLVERKTTRRRK